jgi:F0F1-type ATP synthase assembly protein I
MPTPEDQRKAEIRDYAHKAATQSVLKTTSARDAAEQQQVMQETGPYLTLGIQLALSIAAFFGIGYWLDHHFHTGGLWTAIFTGFGACSSLAYFIIIVLRLSKKEETKSRQKAFEAHQPDGTTT